VDRARRAFCGGRWWLVLWFGSLDSCARLCGIAVALGVFFRQLWEGAWPFGRLAAWRPQSTVTDKSATVTDKSAIVTVAVV
jgi:hypothetical protein